MSAQNRPSRETYPEIGKGSVCKQDKGNRPRRMGPPWQHALGKAEW